MEDESLLKTYANGMFMLAFLDEWDKIERIGIIAKIYNTIKKKHDVFHKQIMQVEKGKKKKYSHKCSIFILASNFAIKAWEDCILETKDAKISANITLHNLHRLDKENFERIYGLTSEDFKKLQKGLECGVTLSSCKVARILLDHLEQLIADGYTNGKNIYEKL